MAIDQVALTRQIKEANDIVVVAGSYLTLLPAGSVYKAICPFHKDTRPSLQISAKFQNFRCWSCEASGDVYAFVEKIEKVGFREAREILARRAGISLADSGSGPNLERLRLLDVMKWAETQYKECLLEAPAAEAARCYLGERRLNGATVRQFGLGYAPLDGGWLTRLARESRQDAQTLLDVGLIMERKDAGGFCDRFRDRLMFPIRDVRGQTVGFGGRILPGSAYATRGPKYYNSSDTPLFKKSDLLYGLDLARHSGATEGFLAVVEGYTDVMMAHQYGITNVVATMGTALTERHVPQLRRYVPRVVLLYDADDGGNNGVDRALELFITQDVDLAIATLPSGMDPCDFLVEKGADEFRLALRNAKDALDFKLNQLLERETDRGIEGTKRVINAILGVMALAPEMPGKAGKIKQELVMSRLASRLGVRLETVWARFGELREAGKKNEARPAQESAEDASPKSGPAPPLERELLEVLLAEPTLVAEAAREIQPDILTHPGLRKLLSALYQIQAAGEVPDIDGLRELIGNASLIAVAMKLMDVGRLKTTQRAKWLRDVLERFRAPKKELDKGQLQQQLANADHKSALEIFEKLKTLSMGDDS